MENIIKITLGPRKIYLFSTYYELSRFTLKTWEKISRLAIELRGHFTVALSGGSTPVGFYQNLSFYLPHTLWKKTHLFLADERFVPLDHEESNFRMIQKNILKRINLPKANIHPMAMENTDPDTCAKKYEQTIREFFHSKKKIPPFDLILLGIGEDGHTASLFPGASALQETHRLVVPVQYEKIKQKRISFSLPLINKARNIIFLAYGQNKAPILSEVLEKNNQTLPASLVDPKEGRLFFFLDKEAGEFFHRD